MELSSQEIVERLNGTRAGTLWEALDISLVSADKERVVLSMPIGPRHKQQAGYLHGGISVLLAETAASIGTALNINLEEQMALGLEINANHLRPKREGRLTAVATPIHRGRTTHVWEIRILDEQEKLVCISRCTLAVVPRPPEAINPLMAPDQASA
ncbi:hotdog fold thioesterase [Thermogemmatispora sp.]|uniref:hotdog fold thioesterase n=1 Tax=Thermogemmatispora sp. TaxID=1968838 RepID=UPI001E008789|nr:hotdog fold thioesterase [Thermogemmatispora sp.]MBX5450858.1 hotdog fold thioesterase [Thermogemmatispora sp.]